MSHTSTTIYSDSSHGVEIADIKYVLNRQESAINDIIAGAGEDGDINIWAKYKPYRSGVLDTTSAARQNANYGLSIEVFESLGSPTTQNSFLYKLVNGDLDWEYLYPRGKGQGTAGSDEWYRILDFDGYNDEAECPVGDAVTTIAVDSVSHSATIAWDLNDNQPSGSIALSDLRITVNGVSTALTSLYLGVLLYRSSSNTWHVCMSTSTLGSGDVQINIADASSLIGTWEAYPFFSSTTDPVSNVGTLTSAGWPSSHVTIEFKQSYHKITVNASWTDSTHSAIEYEVVADNSNSSAWTFTPYFMLRRRNDGTSWDSLSNQDSWSGSQITVAANTVYTSPQPLTRSVSLTDTYDQNYEYGIGANDTNILGVIIDWMDIEEPQSILGE